MVGRLLSNLHNDRFVPVQNGIEGVVRNRGHHLIIAVCHADCRKESPPPTDPYNADGLLIYADDLADEDLADLHSTGFPMVLVHRTPPVLLNIPSATIENVKTAKNLIEHVIQAHGSIAFEQQSL